MNFICGFRPRGTLALALFGSLLVGPSSVWAADPVKVAVLRAETASSAYQATVDAFTGGKGKTGALGRLGFDLSLIRAEYNDHLLNSPGTPFKSSALGFQVTPDATVVVDILAEGDPVALAAKLKTLGLRNGAVAGHIVSGWLPIAALDAAGIDPDIRSLSPSYMIHHSGSVTTQGDLAQRSNLVRLFGLDGSGSKIGVISDSYNAGGGAAAAAEVLAGDLPGVGNPEGHLTPVQVADSPSGSNEGRAMLQIVHDVAPGATLAFGTGNGGIANFANQITALRACFKKR